MKKKAIIFVLTLVLAFIFTGQASDASSDQKPNIYEFTTDPNNFVWNPATHTAEYIEFNFSLPGYLNFTRGKYAVICHRSSPESGDSKIVSTAKLLTNSGANQYYVNWHDVVFELGPQQLAIYDGDPTRDSSSQLKAMWWLPYIISELTPALVSNTDNNQSMGSDLEITFSMGQEFVSRTFPTGIYAVLRYAPDKNSQYVPVGEKNQVENLESVGYRVTWSNAAPQPGRYELLVFDGNSKVQAIGFYEYPFQSNPSQDNPSQDITLRATAGDGYITLDWNAAADTGGLDGYYLYRGTSPGGEDAGPLFDFPINALTYKDTKVVNGTTYYYILKPCYNEGTRLGSASNEASATPTGQTGGTIILTIGSPMMKVNGQDREIDPGQGTAPVIVSERTFLPIRAVIEAMGGTVAWDGGDSKVTIEYNQQSINLWIGKTAAEVNGTTKYLDVEPFISDTSRTMIPLRFVVENLGCDVIWNGPDQTVTINYRKQEV